ncbi:hypothetical protein D3C81_1438720 [compost metagenome]
MYRGVSYLLPGIHIWVSRSWRRTWKPVVKACSSGPVANRLVLRTSSIWSVYSVSILRPPVDGWKYAVASRSSVCSVSDTEYFTCRSTSGLLIGWYL